MKKISKILIILLFTIITLMTLNININPWQLPNSKGIIYEIIITIKEFDIILSLLGIFVFSFYYKTYFNEEKFTKKNIIISIISSICSISIVIGKLLSIDNIGEKWFTSFSHFFKCSILFLGLYLIFYSVIKSLLKLDSLKKLKKDKNQKKKLNKVLEFIDNHYIIITIIFLIICILPYIIIHFPFAANGDTFDVLCQIFHNKNSWTIESINLVNNNVYLNTHHPLLFTLIYGLVVKIGISIHSLTLGVFLYTIFQTIITIIIFTLLMVYLKKINIPIGIRIGILLFIGLNPTICFYTITAVKDTPSALATLVYIVFLLQIIRNHNSILENKKLLISLIITMTLVIAFRPNGAITILLSFPFLFILYKDQYKKLLITLLIPIIIVVSFNTFMYKCFDVSKGSKRELFSVPFQQVARLMRNGYDKEFSKEDKKAISKVLDYETIKKDYYPAISDPVKNTYNKNATNEDLKNFFKVWNKYLYKHPNVYIKSVIASTYQYFYPNEFTEYAMAGIDTNILKNFEIKRLKSMEGPRQNLDYILRILSNIPIIGLIFRVAFYSWCLIISCIYILYKKKYKYLIVMAPLISILLICLASPLNGSMRYILPIVYSVPICIAVNYLVYKESSNEK